MKTPLRKRLYPVLFLLFQVKRQRLGRSVFCFLFILFERKSLWIKVIKSRFNNKILKGNEKLTKVNHRKRMNVSSACITITFLISVQPLSGWTNSLVVFKQNECLLCWKRGVTLNIKPYNKINLKKEWKNN